MLDINGFPLRSLTASSALFALMMGGIGSARADQQPDTINSSYYTQDPNGEFVYTLMTGSDPGNTLDYSGDGPLYVCGISSCSGDVDAEARNPSIDNLNGFAKVAILETGPAGSGFIDPFLRQQHNEQTGNGNRTYETAYNTSFNPAPSESLQELSDGGHQYENMAKDSNAGGGNTEDFNHAILYSDSLQNTDGNLDFLLDINESENTSDILLDELSFFVSLSDTLSVYDPDCVSTGNANTNGSAGCFTDTEAIKVWDMDLDGILAALLLDNTNDSGGAGSGDFDAIFTLDAGLFTTAAQMLTGYSGTFYIYLENTMGRAEAIDANGNLVEYDGDGFQCIDGQGNNTTCTGGEVDAGFEEWAIVAYEDPDEEIPLPSSLVLLGLGGYLLIRQRQKIH